MTGIAPSVMYLIDGHAQFFRAYHAIRSGMTSPVTGEPTNMTFGFAGLLLKLLRDHKPEHLAVVIDASGDRETFRSEIHPAYKAHRESPPDDFRPQVERCVEVLRTMGVPVVSMEGVEADDVIATLVRRWRREYPEARIRIISRDKDLAQLLDDHVELVDLMKDELVTPESIFGVPGIRPDQVVDVLSLMGDTSDNVPGIAGIGPKTAGKLIAEYGSVDRLYQHLDEIKGKRREQLAQGREKVELARRLIVLRDDLPIELPVETARFKPEAIPFDDLSALFRQLGFNTHLETLRAIAGSSVPELPEESVRDSGRRRREASPPKNGGPSLFDPADADDSSGADVQEGRDVRRDEMDGLRAVDGIEAACVRTEAELAEVIRQVRRAGGCAFDTETDSLVARKAVLCGISMAIGPDRGWYIPVRSPEPETHLDESAVLAAIGPLLESPDLHIIGHNVKYDLTVLRKHGIVLAGTILDTMVASYIVDATRSSHSLDNLALGLLGHECIPISRLIGKGADQRTFDRVPLEFAVPYAVEDAVITWRLAARFGPELESGGFGSLVRDVEMPLVRVLAELEWNGIRVDPDELQAQESRLLERKAALRREIDAAAPHPFNPDSPKQLSQVLFGAPDDVSPGLGLKVVKRGLTGPSTDQEVLEKLVDDPAVDSPLPKLVLEYRHLTKLVGTYLVSLREAIDAETGRIHASFHQAVTATGRLSSSDPNLQNIPIRTEVGREIRRAFLADPGHVLVTADYSQIELRMLAHLSEDPALVEAFSRGRDIHVEVAAEVFGVAPEDVTGEQRSAAKMVNFGIVYGITAFGLARRLGGLVTRSEAQKIIDDYRTRFAGIDRFLLQCVQSAHTHGYVETILGRRRRIPEISDRHPVRRALGERMAINSVVQGSAADLIKLAMVDLHARLPAEAPGTRMLLQIHDELVFEAPEDRGEAVRAMVVNRMEQAMPLRVPLVVGAAISPVWIDAK